MRFTYYKSLCTLFLALTFAGSLAGCNTMEGAGQDIEKAGEAIERKAQQHK